jgi:GGDEF domain-containing protein
MISIRESIADLDKIHQLRAAAVDCYLTAIRNIAQYAVELEATISEPFKKHVASLAGEVANASESFLQESKATLRCLLRDYRDKAAQYMAGLHNELSSTTSALQEIMESLSQTDGDHEMKLRSAVSRLRDACRTADAASVRSAVALAADHIEQSLEQLRKQHQVTIAQFHMEIRVLHKRIDALETSAEIDNLTKLLTRAEIEDRIAETQPGHCILMIKVSGIRLAENHFSPDVAAELTAAFTKRLRNTLPPGSPIARWSSEEFLAILAISKADAVTLAKWIAEHLCGPYSCLNEGKTVRPSLQLSVGVIQRGDETADQLISKIGDFLQGGKKVTSARAGPRL